MQLKWLFTVWALVSYTKAQSIDNRNSPLGYRPTDKPVQISEAEIDIILNNYLSGKNVVIKRPVQQPVSTSPQNCVCVPSNQCTQDETDEAQNQLRRIVLMCAADQVCCRPTYITQMPETTASPSIPAINSCGRQNISNVRPERLLNRIMDTENSEAQFGEFPWMAAVFQSVVKPDGTKNFMYVCGGSLIHPQVVMTAAHSILEKENLGVNLGEWDNKLDSEPIPAQSIDVREIIIHEEYNRKVLHNDIGLLILSEPVNLGQSVAPICLPEQGESMDNRDCLSSGWGKNASGRYQARLKKVELPIVSRATCEDALRRKTRLGRRFNLHPSFICAGGEINEDTCKGDGGSPLVCPSRSNPEVYIQAGIVSWGIDCGKDIPATYTNVALFRNWIDNKLRLFNIDIKRGI